MWYFFLGKGHNTNKLKKKIPSCCPLRLYKWIYSVFNYDASLGEENLVLHKFTKKPTDFAKLSFLCQTLLPSWPVSVSCLKPNFIWNKPSKFFFSQTEFCQYFRCFCGNLTQQSVLKLLSHGFTSTQNPNERWSMRKRNACGQETLLASRWNTWGMSAWDANGHDKELSPTRWTLWREVSCYVITPCFQLQFYTKKEIAQCHHQIQSLMCVLTSIYLII